MRFSLRELLLFPVIFVFMVPFVSAATVVGLSLVPGVFFDGTIRQWLVDQNVPIWLVTGHIVFYMLQVPTLLVLSCFALGAFFLRTRIADTVVAVSFCSVPFVDSIGHGVVYLKTQAVTATTIALILCAYFAARRFLANPKLSSCRKTVSLAVLASLFGVSSLLWYNLA